MVGIATRRERVVLELDDQFTTPMAKAAAAAALLNRELNNLSGQAVTTSRASRTIAQDNDRIARSANKADSSINQLTGRLRVIAQFGAAIGPALVPIGAVAIPAIAGLANQMGAAAVAGGVMIAAFQGVGGALEAVNAAQLEPTAANIEKAREAMRLLSPAARDMVDRLQELRPALTALRDTAAGELFPGVLEMFDSLETRGDEVTRIFRNVAAAAGELAADAGADLASDRWTDFFQFMATEVPDTLTSLGHTVGNLAHGMSELWEAFGPLNGDFSSWMLDASRSFDDWAEGLSKTEGFQEFVEYVRTTGPQVAETFGAIANAAIQFVEAAAPIGGPVLRALEGIADAIAVVADSDLGTPILIGVAAWGALTRAAAAYKSVAGSALGQRFGGVVENLTNVTSAQDRARTSAASLAAQADRTDRALSGMGAGFALLGVIEGVNLLDMALDDLLNSDLNTSTLGRSLEALAGGEVMGTLRDVWGESLGGLNDDLNTLDNNLARITDFPDKILPGDLTQTEQARANIAKLDEALAGLVESGQGGQAAQIFNELAEAVERGGNDASQLRDMLEQYRIALSNAGGESISSANAIGSVIPGFNGVEDAARQAASATQVFNGALEELNGLLDKRDALRNYEAALDDFRKNFKDDAGFNIEIKGGRENQALLDSIVEKTGVMASHLKGVARIEFVKGSIAQLRSLAENMNLPKAQVDVLIRALKDLGRQRPKPEPELQNVPKTHSEISGLINRLQQLDRQNAFPAVHVGGVVQSIADINALEARLNSIQDETVFVTVRRIGGPQPGPMADGGTVDGQRAPYGDKVLTYLAPGEEVISNRFGQADRNRELLKAINANRMADGGTVRWASPPAAPTVNVTAQAGGVTVTPLPENQLQRLERALISAAAQMAGASQQRLTAAIKTGGI